MKKFLRGTCKDLKTLRNFNSFYQECVEFALDIERRIGYKGRPCKFAGNGPSRGFTVRKIRPLREE
jgi:hypothetical protein